MAKLSYYDPQIMDELSDGEAHTPEELLEAIDEAAVKAWRRSARTVSKLAFVRAFRNIVFNEITHY